MTNYKNQRSANWNLRRLPLQQAVAVAAHFQWVAVMDLANHLLFMNTQRGLFIGLLS